MKTRLSIALLTTAFLFSCASVTVDLPPLTDEPSNDRQHGRVIWHELLTHTPEASQRFYAELFGWEFENPGAGYGVGGRGGYTLIRHNGQLIGGMIDTNVLNNRTDISQWIMVLSVADVDRVARRARDEGGRVLSPPTDLERRGRLAVVEDAEGAILALLQTRAGDPPERTPEHGDFLWNELWSRDLDGAAGFYAALADFDVEVASTGPDADYRVLKVGDTPRAGILATPVDDVQPVWLNYLRVEDPQAVVAKVDGLGGQVLVDVRDREVGGQAAIIAGPSGAGIALQTWPLD